MKHRSELLPLLLLLLAFPLAAQSVHDALTIEVVDVPVFVTRGNQPVAGLSAEDFELFVNGKPQAIDYFDVAGSRTRVPTSLPYSRCTSVLGARNSLNAL